MHRSPFLTAGRRITERTDPVSPTLAPCLAAARAVLSCVLLAGHDLYVPQDGAAPTKLPSGCIAAAWG